MEGVWVRNRERRSLPLTVPTPGPGAVRKTWSEGFLHLRGCTNSQNQHCTHVRSRVFIETHLTSHTGRLLRATLYPHSRGRGDRQLEQAQEGQDHFPRSFLEATGSAYLICSKAMCSEDGGQGQGIHGHLLEERKNISFLFS